MYCMISTIMYFGRDETWRQGEKKISGCPGLVREEG